MVLSLLMSAATAVEPAEPPTVTFDLEAPRLERARRWHRFGLSGAAMSGAAAGLGAVGGTALAWQELERCETPDGEYCGPLVPWQLPYVVLGLTGGVMIGVPAAPAVTVTSLGTAVSIRRAGGRVSVVPGVLAAVGLVGTIGVLAGDPALDSDASKAAFTGGLILTNGLGALQVGLNHRALRRREAALSARDEPQPLR